MRHGSKPTIRDVAEAAGVSLTTVSYVLSGRSGGTTRISQPTQDRVHAAARELGYVPNRAARGMRRGRTDARGRGRHRPRRFLGPGARHSRGQDPAAARLPAGHPAGRELAAVHALRRRRRRHPRLRAGRPDAADFETMAELAGRGVAQLVFSDTLRPDGFDVFQAGYDVVPPEREPRGPGRARRRALLLGRLRG